MKNQTASQTILKWLRENKIPLGALTSHDTAALLAAVQIANLWIRGDTTRNRIDSAKAFGLIVCQMQETTRFMAFHSIAHVGDWCHRPQLWHQAELPPLYRVPECYFGPGVQFITATEVRR
jgi:hypothetical protein